MYLPWVFLLALTLTAQFTLLTKVIGYDILRLVLIDKYQFRLTASLKLRLFLIDRSLQIHFIIS